MFVSVDCCKYSSLHYCFLLYSCLLIFICRFVLCFINLKQLLEISCIWWCLFAKCLWTILTWYINWLFHRFNKCLNTIFWFLMCVCVYIYIYLFIIILFFFLEGVVPIIRSPRGNAAEMVAEVLLCFVFI